MRDLWRAAITVVAVLGVAGCQPSSEQLDSMVEQQSEILAKLKTLEANQKRILAARPAAAPRKPSEDYSKVYKIDVGNAPILGSASAPVTIVEYSDFQCPYCARATPPLKEVQKKFGDDKVKIVFKHFPLSFHKGARPAAVAAVAAQEQGKFWEMHDVLFANQRALAKDKMVGYAEQAGLDVARFKKDMAEKGDAYGKAVDADFRQGQSVSVRGTPTLFINGKKVQDRSVQGMAAMIESALKAKGS